MSSTMNVKFICDRQFHALNYSVFCHIDLFLLIAVPLMLALALHGVSTLTVAVQVKLNEPASLNERKKESAMI